MISSPFKQGHVECVGVFDLPDFNFSFHMPGIDLEKDMQI